MRLTLRTAALALVAAFAIPCVEAALADTSLLEMQMSVEDVEKSADKVDQKNNKSEDQQPYVVPLDDELKTLLRDVAIADLRYQRVSIEHRDKVFGWHHFSTRVIFCLVVGMVCLGLWFSWLQFRREGGAEGKPAVTKLSAGSEGISVSSPVLGVVILVISLGFFFLYLVHVYPIRVLDEDRAGQQNQLGSIVD